MELMEHMPADFRYEEEKTLQRSFDRNKAAFVKSWHSIICQQQQVLGKMQQSVADYFEALKL